MAVDTLTAKAHELIGQLDHGKLAAVVHLLEVMVHNDEHEQVTEEDRRRLLESRAHFANGGRGVPMERCWPTSASPWPTSRSRSNAAALSHRLA